MARLEDATKFILEETGRIPVMKLQKLVYYCQAWSLVWDERPLFRAKIEAWANGPVVPRLYSIHRGRFDLGPTDIKGDSSKLTVDQKDTIKAVLDFYGDKNSQWLSDLTHMEKPWKLARKGVPEGIRSNKVISLESMSEYYSSIEG